MQDTSSTEPTAGLRGRLPWSGWVALASALALTLLGLVVLSSAGRSFSEDPYFILKRQLVWLCIAGIGFRITCQLNIDAVRPFVVPLALGAIALLGVVLVPGIGVEVNGARRWLDLGFARLQPSDFAKPAFVLVLASYLGANQRHLRSFFRGFVVPCIIIALPCLLVILEPDFGTTVLYGAVGATILFVVGVPMLYMFPSVILAISGFLVLVYNDPVRLARITSFLDVEGNRQDTAYQLWQGMLAFGVGGMDGVGLGNGRQQLSFLPEAHTDFIFPIIGEEMGFIATSAVVVLFASLFLAVALGLRRAPSVFQFTVVLGSILFVSFQCLINVGVVTGLLPTKGMSLPFISYGGSNLVVTYVFIGLIINAMRTWEAPPLAGTREL